MTDRENRRVERFGRVKTFGKSNAGDFAPASKATGHFTNVGNIIKKIEVVRTAQKGGDRTAKEVLLDSLRLDVQNIARTADAIEQDQPGFAAPFRLPESPSHTALLTAVDSYIIELKKPGIAAQFIAHELPEDFVANLEEDRQSVDTAQDAEQTQDNEGVESTATIGRLIRDGNKEVKYLNAIMHNKYSRNPEKLRAWESASHIERAPQREKPPTVTVVNSSSSPPQANAA